MIPIEIKTPNEVAQTLAHRVKALRLDRRWTQQEVAGRAGITLATYRRFERTGRIALERLLKVAVVLDALSGFDQLFARSAAQSLAELEQRSERPVRKRGRRGDAQA